MKVKWLADAREIPVTVEGVTTQVDVDRRKVVDLPADLARSFIDQGLAEAAPERKKES